MFLIRNHDAEQAIRRSCVQVDMVLDLSPYRAMGKIRKKKKNFDFWWDRSLLSSGNRDFCVAAERIEMKTKSEKGQIGQRFDNFLREQ
jgi:hypothetical protein